MTFARRLLLALALPLALVATPRAEAGVGDLLVAPTRIVLNGSRGTEIVLSNIGDDVATYRISVELRRMTGNGSLDDVAVANEREKIAQGMILYAPRRVTIAPNQPQTIRIAARAPAGLADGEYRAHLLFRAVPPPRPVAPPTQVKGVSFELIPIYGVTIPVVVRLGNLQAKVAIANVALASANGKPAVALDLTRAGDRSVFGDVRVFKAGIKDPIAIQRGVAIYTEIETRHMVVPLNPAFATSAAGPVTVEFVESTDSGPVSLAETKTVLR
ncbi:MAG: molecular chaperone [Sphingomonas bacterium]|nr:molecular chaperone [Sphingomonas bacterium]